MPSDDLIWTIVGFVLTLLILSHIIGDNPLFRIVTYLFVGVASGAVAVIAIYQVIWPKLILPILRGDYLTIIPLVLSLGIFTGAYVAEIVRAGIQSVARGQMEASLSVGMTNMQAMRLVILPQAIRRILPALAGQFISLIKDSSLVSVFGYAELTHAANRVTAATFRALVPNVFVAAVYFVIAYSLSQVVSLIERRTARSGQV